MSIFYLDPLDGNDSTTATPLGWWSVAYTGGDGTQPVADETATGATSGATAKVTVVTVSSGTWAGGNAAGTVYFYGKSATAFQSEQVDFSGGAHMHITADLTYCPWKTITSGATSARITAGDVIRIKKSPDPTSLGNGTWTAKSTYADPSTKSITNATNATPIQITANGHGYSTGDIVWITGVGGNLAANSAWIITYVDANNFTLDGSVGSGAYTSGGTAQLWNWKCVKLATACTATVDNCDSAWTAKDANYTVTIETTEKKEGYGSMKCVYAAGAGVEKSAYRQISSTDFSGYQQLSFWIYNSVALAAGDLQIKLCSDTAGDTPVDTFDIPACPSTARWICFTVNKGSALGSAIQSVALYQAVDKGAMTVYLDNLIACKSTASADSLSLISLISKNSAAQGGDEGWYGIQSIKDKIIVLDNNTNTRATAGRGYWSATTPETCTTYKRECFRLTLASATSTTVQAVQESGGGTSFEEYQGGYGSDDNAQDGETFWDGANGYGYGLVVNYNYIKLNHLNFTRYYLNLYLQNNAIEIDTIQTIGNFTYYGILMANGCKISTISNIINGDIFGLDVTGYGNSFGKISITGVGGGNYYGLVVRTANNRFREVACRNCYYGAYIYTYPNGTVIYKLDTAICTTPVYTDTGNIVVNNWLDPSGTYSISTTTWSNGKAFCQNLNRTAGNHYIFIDGGTIYLQTGTVHGTSAWKFTTAGSYRMINFPLYMPLVRIQVTNGVTYTISAWCKKDHASNVGARLVCRGGQVAGVASDVYDEKTNDTDWEQLSVEITPTESGVVDIEAWIFYVAGNSNVYFDSELSVTPS